MEGSTVVTDPVPAHEVMEGSTVVTDPVPALEVMEGSTVVTDPEPALEEREVTSVVETGHGPAEWMGSNGSGGSGDGGEASSPWSLTKEQQERNLRENWIRFLECYIANCIFSIITFDHFFEPWHRAVVAKLRVDPCLDSYDELELKDHSYLRHGMPGLRMTSLEAAILMGDLKMVQKILETRSNSEKLMHRSPMDKERVLTGYFIHVISPKKNDILYTSLHMAVASGDIHIVDALLEKGANVDDKNWLYEMPLDYAWKIRRVDILLKLMEKDTKGRDPFHIAVRSGDIDFMKKLPSQNANVLDYRKWTPLHYLATYHHNLVVFTSTMKYLAEDNKLDVKALDAFGLSAFYMGVRYCNTQFVIALLDCFKDRIRLNEICDEDFGPPIQIAFEGGSKFKDIEAALMECDPVKSFMERLYRDRQVYVDAANAILVGAALIASVTFASWLQPPLNYTSYSGEGYSSSSTSDLNYADVEHNIPLRVFWVFNALSFYFAIATVVCGARSVLPRSHLFIKKTVDKLRINLLVTSFLLACSVLFVIIAFAIAGTIVLTPLLKYQWYMIVPTLIGGMVCIVSLVFLVKSMVENSSNRHEYKNELKDREMP